MVELVAGRHLLAPIDPHADALVSEDGLPPQPRLDRGDSRFHGHPLFFRSPDRHDHDVDRRDPWWQDEAPVIAVDLITAPIVRHENPHDVPNGCRRSL